MSITNLTERYAACEQGHRHWGTAGAAGILFTHVDEDGDRWYLLQHRGEWVHEADTWGIPGGAIDRDESPLTGATREFQEEVRSDVPWFDATVVDTNVDDHGGWAYTTFVVQVPKPFRARPSRDGETGKHGLMWVRRDDALTLDLHSGVRAYFEGQAA